MFLYPVCKHNHDDIPMIEVRVINVTMTSPLALLRRFSLNFFVYFFIHFTQNLAVRLPLHPDLHRKSHPGSPDQHPPLQTRPSDVFRHHEILRPSDLILEVVRRSTSDPTLISLLKIGFRAFGTDFVLYLRPSHVVSSRFAAVAINGDGGASKVRYVPDNSFFSGHLMGRGLTHATAHLHPNSTNLIQVFVDTGSEVFFVENLANSFSLVNEDGNYIVYRGSDLLFNSINISKIAPPLLNIMDRFKKRKRKLRHFDRKRYKRDHSTCLWDDDDDDERKMCSLRLVADFKFFQHMGNSDNTTTINYIIGVIDRINKIFQRTVFVSKSGKKFTNFGFQVHEIIIHNQKMSKGYNYNTHHRVSSKELLKRFSFDPRNGRFCLAHLFTYQQFEGGVLGLAYTAPPANEMRHKEGGMCAAGIFSKNDGRNVYLNTGLSTTKNYAGRRLVTKESDLVVAHELGHGWGSEHDPERCIHDKGGHYIMHMYSVNGRYDNNKMFSNCSKLHIGLTLSCRRLRLLSDASTCFSKTDFSYCGNSRVEKHEECDSGQVEDKCCQDCKLNKSLGAKCSPTNEFCCSPDTCDFAPKTLVCANSTSTPNCDGVAYCPGDAGSCGRPQSKPEGAACLEGNCSANGSCILHCETISLVSCTCNETQDACRICCDDPEGGNCTPRPEIKATFHLDGWPCGSGACEDGVCKRMTTDVVVRYFKYFVQNDFLVVLRDNLVCFVLIFTTALWLPASCVIASWDRKRGAELRRLREDADAGSWHDEVLRRLSAQGFSDAELETPDLSFSGNFEAASSASSRDRSSKNVSFGLWDIVDGDESSQNQDFKWDDPVQCKQQQQRQQGQKTKPFASFPSAADHNTEQRITTKPFATFPSAAGHAMELEPKRSELYNRRKSFALNRQKNIGYDLSIDVIPEESSANSSPKSPNAPEIPNPQKQTNTISTISTWL